MADGITITKDGAVLILRFERADKKNAITAAMYDAMANALRQAEDDGQIRAVIFRGSGGVFTAGNDLGDFLANPPSDERAPVFAFLSALASASLPYVAAVDGEAIGIGTTLLLHCDFVLVTARARLQTPFVNLGLVPEAASSLLLPRLLGHARAAELLLLGDAIDGARAVELGLANRLAAPETLNAEAAEIAHLLAQKPPQALRAAKTLMRAGHRGIEAAMAAEARIFTKHLVSPEAREAFAAFLEKRTPRFDAVPEPAKA